MSLVAVLLVAALLVAALLALLIEIAKALLA